MKDYKVRDFMVPTDKLATVPQTANLYEAVDVFEQTLRHLEQDEFRYRALLVVDENGEGVAKLSLLDIIAGLEPKYADVESMKIPDAEMSKEQMQAIFRQYGLWDNSLLDICRQAGEIHVSDVMNVPDDADLVHENESLSFAVHQFAISRNHDLLVHDAKNRITGMIRLPDVYRMIRDNMDECQLKQV